MLSAEDFVTADGSTDWAAYRQAQIEEGRLCYKCGGYILLGKRVGRALCADCQILSAKDTAVQHPIFVRCPECGHTWNPGDEDDYSVYEDGEHEVACGVCDHNFEISTTVRYTFESPERVQEAVAD
jgi:NMD protein affecting ribosome stability and mRNA decay